MGADRIDVRPAHGNAALPKCPAPVEGTARFLVTFAAAIAAVVAFAWASQARQDDAIRGNETAIAVINARLDFICEKLTEIRAMLAEGVLAEACAPVEERE